MFDFDAGKLIVIGIVALIAIPSKDLPRVLRTLGQVTGRMRRMAAEFQGQFSEALREAELDDLKKEIEETNAAIMAGKSKLDGAFDPLAEARKQIASAVEDVTPAASAPAHDGDAEDEEDADDAPQTPGAARRNPFRERRESDGPRVAGKGAADAADNSEKTDT